MAKEKTQFPSSLKTIFWLLVVVFGLILSIFLVPVLRENVRGALFLLPFAILTILGSLLLFLTLRLGIKGKLKKLLLAVGLSASSIFVSIILHNFTYALAQIISRPPILRTLFDFLQVIFFFVAIPVAPLGLLISVFLTIRFLFSQNNKR